MDSMQVSAPTGYRASNMDQVLLADTAGWVRVAKVDSLKQRLDGSLPPDAALDGLRTDLATMSHFMPVPRGKADKPTGKPTKLPPVKRDASPKKPTKGGRRGPVPSLLCTARPPLWQPTSNTCLPILLPDRRKCKQRTLHVEPCKTTNGNPPLGNI